MLSAAWLAVVQCHPPKVLGGPPREAAALSLEQRGIRTIVPNKYLISGWFQTQYKKERAPQIEHESAPEKVGLSLPGQQEQALTGACLSLALGGGAAHMANWSEKVKASN